jgi:signal transduction histidine kinase
MSMPAAHQLPPLRALRVGLHALVVGLLAIVVARAQAGADHVTPVAWVGLLFLLAYAAGGFVLLRHHGRLGPSAWVVGVTLLWLVLVWTTADAVWLAFPLFFLFLHFLPRPWGIAMVGLTAVAAIAAYGIHDGLTPASVIGPLIGAGVAVGTVLAYEALLRESQERQRLIDDLTATRSSLARREREAGAHAERERLAREIHDTLAQGLASIQLLLRAAERDVGTDPGAAARRIGQARETAQTNLEEARRVVRALPPPGLEQGSLADALREVARAASVRSGVAVDVQVSGEEQHLPEGVAAALLRIAQSAIANTVEHSRARRASATLTYMHDEVVLDVVDDGTGFDPSRVRATSDGGYGLSVMRARAEALGGRLNVESEQGGGTAVAATFPLGGTRS